jgi:integrase/recombinase XerD
MRKRDPRLPSRRPRMDAGALGPHVERFAEHLIALGHSRLTVTGYSDSARHFADWLCRVGIVPNDVDNAIVEQFAHHRCQCPGGRRGKLVSPKYVNCVRRFVRFLTETGVVPVVPPAAATGPTDPWITEFLEWLRCHRGVSARTLELRGHVVKRLLPALGSDPATYDVGGVRRVILDEARRSSAAYVRTMTMTLRGYLRFLAARGLCRPWLDQAVPTVPHWRLSSLPRYLPMSDVERLIASCDVTTPGGVRDRAILLLLIRLGLRAGDVLGVSTTSIGQRERCGFTAKVGGRSACHCPRTPAMPCSTI